LNRRIRLLLVQPALNSFVFSLLLLDSTKMLFAQARTPRSPKKKKNVLARERHFCKFIGITQHPGFDYTIQSKEDMNLLLCGFFRGAKGLPGNKAWKGIRPPFVLFDCNS
jgi:hypothetical protein